MAFVQARGRITRLEAAAHVGCFELAARIAELEREGFMFTRRRRTVKNRYGDKVSITEYALDARPSLAQGELA